MPRLFANIVILPDFVFPADLAQPMKIISTLRSILTKKGCRAPNKPINACIR